MICKIRNIISKGNPKFGAIKMRKDEVKFLYPDIKKVKKEFKWSPKVNISEGLKKLLNFMKIKNKPLVSVIMNCRNGEKYLKQSIRSVVNQSYLGWS